jgi:2-oxoglutarate/2-oxoacid ferredoxin oxidoreductase subunit alpha
MARELIKGNVAFAEAAIRAGLQAYYGYPITPQTEALEWMSKRMPELGRTFLQAESELAAINMVYGAACAGVRVMTSSSSPGISLMLEGISYIAGSEVPAVIVDVMRGGPGLGNIAPAQGDYNQIVKGGGHGDYHPIVLAPASIQEAIDQTVLAFELAEKYRSVVIVLIDGVLGQMMEPAELPPMQKLRKTAPDWAVTGAEGRGKRILNSLYINPVDLEVTDLRLLQRWIHIQENEVRCREYFLEDAKIAVIGYGSAGRVALSAVRAARDEGIPVGLLRPVTLHPFPSHAVDELSQQVDSILVVEMSTGQMLEDVLRDTRQRVPVEFFARLGGIVPLPGEILSEIRRVAKEPLPINGHPRNRWFERVGLNFLGDD